MDISQDYIEGTLTIIFWEGENPENAVPDGWKIVERNEPSTYKGFVNPGALVCKKDEDNV